MRQLETTEHGLMCWYRGLAVISFSDQTTPGNRRWYFLPWSWLVREAALHMPKANCALLCYAWEVVISHQGFVKEKPKSIEAALRACSL